MTTTRKTDRRAELVERLAAITVRIDTRAGELAGIEARQLAAAAAGDIPDRALSTAKAALADEQSIDGRAAAAVRAELDQHDAAELRLQELADLAKLRRDAAATARAAHEAADGFPAAFEAAEDAVRAAAGDLCARLAEVTRLTGETVRLNDAVQALAQRLGEPCHVVGVVNHLERLAQRYGVADIPRARVFSHAQRTPAEAARELAVSAYTPRPHREPQAAAEGVSSLTAADIHARNQERVRQIEGQYRARAVDESFAPANPFLIGVD